MSFFLSLRPALLVHIFDVFRIRFFFFVLVKFRTRQFYPFEVISSTYIEKCAPEKIYQNNELEALISALELRIKCGA